MAIPRIVCLFLLLVMYNGMFFVIYLMFISLFLCCVLCVLLLYDHSYWKGQIWWILSHHVTFNYYCFIISRLHFIITTRFYSSSLVVLYNLMAYRFYSVTKMLVSLYVSCKILTTTTCMNELQHKKYSKL